MANRTTGPGLLTDESRWLAKNVRMLRMIAHQNSIALLTESVTFTIGDGGLLTPLDGTTEYNNPAIPGNQAFVFLSGTGKLAANTYTTLPGQIVLTASTFTTGQTYTILF